MISYWHFAFAICQVLDDDMLYFGVIRMQAKRKGRRKDDEQTEIIKGQWQLHLAAILEQGKCISSTSLIILENEEINSP